MKIIFKNVGQGDSIILEWKIEEQIKIAIIDCNLYNGKNPVLEHLINSNVSEVEFAMLSHPHSDHFSGFYNLLSYCKVNNIKVKKFLHTSELPDFLKKASRSISSDNELFKLFSLIRKLRVEAGLKLHTIDDNENLKIPLGEGFSMEVLSPSSIERDNYQRGIEFPFDEEGGGNNPNANWLSTLLKIYNKNYCVILTSDVESKSLSRIGRKVNGRICNDTLAMAQIPHHGSKGNLNEKFWQFRKRHETTLVVISVGENGYKHPSKDVVDFFKKTPNYELVSTNMTGALSSISDRTRAIIQILDTISDDNTTTIGSKYDGDKIFHLTEVNCNFLS